VRAGDRPVAGLVESRRGRMTRFSPLGAGRPSVTVILPCLNESSAIVECVHEAQEGLEQAGLSGEVLVVDNGSTDGSASLAAQAGARVVAEERRGYGSALRRGIAEARGTIIVMADADRTYRLDRLGELVAPVAEGIADVVLGSRLDRLNPGTMPLLHRLIGTPAISFALRRACPGLRVKDSQSGYRAFHAEKVRALGLQAAGMEFASEMLIRASQEGLSIQERPLEYRPRVGPSKLNTLTDGWRHLQLILLLAPQLILFWPGLALLALGALLTTLSLLNPVGFGLGPLRWQPIFLGPIMVVLGTMGVLAGAVVAYHSTLPGPRVKARFALVGHAKFPGRCVNTGILALVGGMALDVFLFAAWVTDGSSPSRALALAGVAQALVITGVVLAGFGVLYRILVGQSAYRNQQAGGDILPFRFGIKPPVPADTDSVSAVGRD
jgi:glycosyltransferase involved in cell wall biosynthesis